uniref:hypothetical protein n=1 Tax=Pectobacterium odoriferum TaxID=78398 RepID=UPI0006893F43|nr:hypothetical protein [Pectobacterium odoriferum]
MPVRKVCHFFLNALASTHQYRQHALIDSTTALINGATLSLTRIGRYLPGPARVKDKIKRVDRLLGNTALHNDIPKIFNQITSMKTGERLWVLSLLATLASIVLWLLGYHVENKGLHLHYQASSLKSRRVISFLTLAENVLRHSPQIARRVKLESILAQLTSTYRNMVLVY